jgi:formylglycine-generating enzyme required for sulfatase activity
LGDGVELTMVLIPKGKFLMGSPNDEANREDDEMQHKVTISKPFYMGKFEVTQEQWELLMGTNPSEFKGKKVPVTDVTWYECQNFIKNLNKKTKKKFRLPTEAEWLSWGS